MIERHCPVCATLYQADPVRLRHGRQTTCSRACSYKHRADHLTTSTTTPCAVCGTPVTRPASHRKSEKAFCSRDCHYKGRSQGLVKRVVTEPYDIGDETRAKWADLQRARNAKRKAEGRYAMSDETKAKLSISVSQAIAAGKFAKVSKLEREVGEVLAKMGVKALPQHPFRDDRGRFGACVDFYLPDLGIALEVNGTFWHADPLVYPNGPVKPSQHRSADRYARKMALLKRLGVPVVEVWEIDFRADPESVVRGVAGNLRSEPPIPAPA